MPLIRNGAVADDAWATAGTADDLIAPGPVPGPVIVTLDLWESARGDLLARGTPLGVRLRSDESPDRIAADLEHLEVIALEFPKFTDGRAYSYARILRQRYGFRGEIRAVGAVLRDQFLFMHRCGFDAFEIADGTAADAWTAAVNEFSVWYQPAADARASVPAAPSPSRSRVEPP